MAALSFSRATAADATSLSEDEIDRAIKRGALKAKSRGRRIVILRADLEAFLESLDDYEPRAEA